MKYPRSSDADYPGSYTEYLPIGYLRDVLAVAQENGVDPVNIVEKIGISEDTLADNGAHFSSLQDFAAFDAIEEVRDIPGFGLLVAARERIRHHGVVGYAMMCSYTLRKAIERFVRYQAIIDPAIRTVFESSGTQAFIHLSERFPLQHHYRYRSEMALGHWKEMNELFPDEEPAIVAMEVTWDKPEYASLYDRLLACPMVYSRPENRILLRPQLLDRPMQLANREVARLCVQQCETYLQSIAGTDNIVHQVSEVLRGDLSENPNLVSVASRLNMSPRTLRRHLQQAGRSFRQIHDSLRMDLAAHYLRNTAIPAQKIAFQLGYADTSNFHRAFRRYWDQTPIAYRQSHRSDGVKPQD